MIDYQLDPSRRIATTRVTGRLTFAEVANHIHRLIRDRAFHPDFDAVIIATGLAAVPPPSAVGSLAPLVRAWSARRRGARWAFVLPTAESRAFAERALAEVRLAEVSYRCFGSEQEALAWLDAKSLPSLAPLDPSDPRGGRRYSATRVQSDRRDRARAENRQWAFRSG